MKEKIFPPVVWLMLQDTPWGWDKQRWQVIGSIRRNYCHRRQALGWECDSRCLNQLIKAVRISTKANPQYLPAYLGKILRNAIALEADLRQEQRVDATYKGGEFTVAGLLEAL